MQRRLKMTCSECEMPAVTICGACHDRLCVDHRQPGVVDRDYLCPSCWRAAMGARPKQAGGGRA